MYSAHHACALAQLLPETVSCATTHDGVAPEPLFPGEEQSVEGALERRQREFAIGRMCARRAMSGLGVAPTAIPTSDRAPVWPAGLVGSITHTDGFVAAAVARGSELAGLGIDAESRTRPLRKGLERYVCTVSERDRLTANGVAAEDVLRVIFGGKESVHKCVAPMSGITLGFHDVELDLDWASGSFEARLTRAHDLRLPDFQLLNGRFTLTAGHVITTAIIPAAAWLCSGDATVSPCDVARVG